MKKLSVILIAGALLLSGCTSLFTPERVFYFDRSDRQDAYSFQTVPIFIDDRGDLYPKTGIPENFKRGLKNGTGSLHWMAKGSPYDENAPKVAGSGSLCGSVVSGETEKLCNEDWDETQWIMWRDRAQITEGLLERGGDDAILVVLIHGFNVPDATKDYELLKHKVSAAAPQKNLVFLEVHWNGYIAKKFDQAWGEGQFSGPLAGFGLRRFFNALQDVRADVNKPLPPIRFVTHSSGAFVLGATLGNPYNSLPKLQEKPPKGKYASFFEHRTAKTGKFRIPELSDAKAAMIAPATSPDTFLRTNEINGGSKPAGTLAPNLTILFTLNEDDQALRKKILRKGVLPARWTKYFGSTSLGTDPEQAKRLTQASSDQLRFVEYEFTPSTPFPRGTDTHAISTYMRHSEAKGFIDHLMMNID